MTSPIDELLARARLRRRPYTEADIEGAAARLAARAALPREVPGDLPCRAYRPRPDPCSGSGVLDGPTPRGGAPWRPGAPARGGAGEGLPASGGPGPGGADRPLEDLLPEGVERGGSPYEGSAAEDLRTLCETVVTHAGALADLGFFLAGALPEPAGARVLGCMLHIAGSEESARFWWQYAGGAGDPVAGYCLHLHHRALGEHGAADWWHAQHVQAGFPGGGAAPFGLAIPTVLRILRALRPDGSPVSEAVEAVLHYVPAAVAFVDDDLDLPLPDPDFADRVRALAATCPAEDAAADLPDGPRRSRRGRPLPERRRVDRAHHDRPDRSPPRRRST
ncbi:hypothetical protein AB0F07_26935 [Streptomyces fructofermentans]|uniref:hypothetical protein n=1 Tax=Streptomyces fructofermentans TaxID=152141 RepID=UPI0033F19AAF